MKAVEEYIKHDFYNRNRLREALRFPISNPNYEQSPSIALAKKRLLAIGTAFIELLLAEDIMKSRDQEGIRYQNTGAWAVITNNYSRPADSSGLCRHSIRS